MCHSRKSGFQLGVVLLAVGIVTPWTASAQVLDESYGGSQFYFFTPGARAMGMGGAFLGLADDASAAFTNPAGLTALEGSSVMIESRDLKYKHLFPEHGHQFGQATLKGFDDIDHVVYGESTNDLYALGFLSYTYAGDGWAIGAYRHQLADFQATYQTSGVYVGNYNIDPEVNTLDRLYPAGVDYNFDIASYGLSFSFDLGESFSVGVSAVNYDFTLNALTKHYYYIPDITLPTDPEFCESVDAILHPEQFYCEPEITDNNLFSTSTQHGSDNDFGFNVGLLWRVSDMVWVGAAYRVGPRFDMSYSRDCLRTLVEGDKPCSEFTVPGTFEVPDVYGIGVAVMPSESWTLTFDVNQVQYSSLVNDFTGSPDAASEFRYLKVDDGTQLHLGAEYVMTSRRNPLSFRLGTWLDPNHQLRYEGSDLLLRAMFSAANENKDRAHFTGGIGWVYRERLRLDLGFDASDRISMMSLSAAYTF